MAMYADPREADTDELDRRSLMAQMGQRPEAAQPSQVSEMRRMPAEDFMAGITPTLGTKTPAGTGIAPQTPIDQPAARQFSMPTELHGRAAVHSDPNDLLHIAAQQQGFDVSSNDAVRRTYEEIIKPLFEQQGMQADLIDHERLDKLNVGGRVFDFVGNSGGAGGGHFWVGEEGAGGGAPGGGGEAAPAPAASGGTPGSIASLVPTDAGFYESAMARLQEILGGPQAFDREALMRLMAQ